MNYFKQIINSLKVEDKDHLSSIPYAVKQTIAACLIGAMVTVGVVYYNDYKHSVYEVHYDGKIIGYVKDIPSADQIFEQVKTEIKQYEPSLNINDHLEFQKVRTNSATASLNKSIEQDIKTDLYNRITHYAISVNGKEVALVGSEDEAKKVIQGVKDYFAEAEKKNGAQEVDVNIKDKIEISSRLGGGSNQVDSNTAINALIGSKNEVKQYQIKQGDTLWTIARDNGVKVNDIIATNPGLSADKIQAGQTVNLNSAVPNLNVEVTYTAAVEEEIPYETQYTTDSSMTKGQSKVVESGENGTKKIMNKITKLNGQEIAKTMLTASIVKDPVVRILAKGTKDIVGSGSFLWPARGRMTSGYGSRADGFHSGMDISAPEGTPIYAADDGKVVQAGWYYGYGKLVIIDHGNGYRTYYGHCSEINVSVGQQVSRGENIAEVGHTGDAQGSHVHFEVRLNGSTQNPARYLN